jgi:hypothetical protein
VRAPWRCLLLLNRLREARRAAVVRELVTLRGCQAGAHLGNEPTVPLVAIARSSGSTADGRPVSRCRFMPTA